MAAQRQQLHSRGLSKFIDVARNEYHRPEMTELSGPEQQAVDEVAFEAEATTKLLESWAIASILYGRSNVADQSLVNELSLNLETYLERFSKPGEECFE